MINLLRDAGHSGLIVQVTGEPGTGKTKFALSTGAEFSEMVLLNADVKRALVGQLIKSGIEFGYYRDVVADTEGMKEIAYHLWYLERFDEIEALPVEKRRVIVLDPWESFERTLKPMVEKNPRQFRDYWSVMGQFKGPQQWMASHEYSAAILSRLAGLCEVLVLTSHLRNAYRGNTRVPGKFKPDNKIPIEQKADIRLWTRPNVGPVPIGLLMKRGLMKVVVMDGKVKLENVLPRKLTPREDEGDLWDVIKRYWEEPFGNRKPTSAETPNAFELSILEGTLTDSQRYAWEAAVRIEKEEDELLESGNKEKVKEMAGKSVMEIAKELGVGVPEAARLVAEAT